MIRSAVMSRRSRRAFSFSFGMSSQRKWRAAVSGMASPTSRSGILTRKARGYTARLPQIPLKEKVGVSLVLAPFFLGGLLGFFFLGARPLWRWYRASGWVETGCVIESTSTRVVTHTSDDADTYQYDLRYSYEFR